MNELTLKQRAVNHETWRHIHRVQELVFGFVEKLIRRAHVHDQSKLESPEVEYFAECTERLKGLTYGSDEYRQCLREIKPAIQHHNAHNSHHPEHYPEGIDGMDLLDLLELVCDWKAASERHDNGDILKSIEINEKRFKMSPQLVAILRNTIKRYIL